MRIFLCVFMKVTYLKHCPPAFKPVFYRRYIDDTFLLFRDKSHVELFHKYLNEQHPNIKFTYEVERSKKLSFLDITITRESTFKTSVYRKPTFTGLGSSFFQLLSYEIQNHQHPDANPSRFQNLFHVL